MRLRSRLTALAIPSFAVALAGFASAAAEFAPHRATYALSKGTTRAGQAVSAVSGTMVIEVDESCEGWSLSQRIRVVVSDSLGGDVESDNRYASFESKDGTRLRFQGSDWQDGNLVEETVGTAERPARDQPGVATFTKPEAKTFDLPPGALFPSAFNLELVRMMGRSEPFVSLSGFDGGNLEGAYTITVFFGKERDSELTLKPSAEGAPADDRKTLLGGKVRNVRVAYFPLNSKAPEPELEYEMELQANGVSPIIRLEYQKYQVMGRLTEIKALARPDCKK